MANLITTMLLKTYEPSNPNRDESGEAKQIMVGGTIRSEFSPQAFFRAVKKRMGKNIKTIRTAHLEDLIESILLEMVKEGTIKPEQVDYYGNILCKPKKKDDNNSKKNRLFDCSWSERASVGGSKSEDAKDNKGRTMTVISPDQLYAVINAVLSCPEGTTEAGYEKAANEALKNVHISSDQALFGTMATSGVLGSIPSAILKGSTYSIDAFCPTNDFITASFMEQGVDETDPFYGSIKTFAEHEASLSRAQNMASAWEYSNTMYTKAAIDIGILNKNLTRNPVGGYIQMPKEEIEKEAKEKVFSFVEAFANATPEGSRTSRVTASNPGILYMESIKDGDIKFENFVKVLKANEKETVMEQGIRQFVDYADNEALNEFYKDVNKYVYLDKRYRRFEKDFENAGVTVIRNLRDLENALNAEVERLS